MLSPSLALLCVSMLSNVEAFVELPSSSTSGDQSSRLQMSSFPVWDQVTEPQERPWWDSPYQAPQQRRVTTTPSSPHRMPHQTWIESEHSSLQHAPSSPMNKSNQQQTLYQILGASPTDSKAVLRRNYLLLAKQTHPDADHGNAEAFRKIAAAWQILSDSRQRLQYDRSLKADAFTDRISEWIDQVAARIFIAVDTTLQQWMEPNHGKGLPQRQPQQQS